MKNLFCFFAGIVLLASGLTSGLNAQTKLLNTTLSAAIDSKTQIVTLAAVTNITAAGNPIATSDLGSPSGTSQWIAYVDREAMEVVSLSSTTLTVRRGRQGTKSNAHVSGAKVLAGPVSAFVVVSPSGVCTRTSMPYVPVVNVLTGVGFDCMGGQFGNFTDTPQVGTVIASQGGVMTGAYAIIAKVTHISGTAAITGFDVPAALPDGGQFVIVPDGAFTWTAATNIVSTGTGVVGKSLTFTWDRVAGKLYPSY